MPILCVAQFYGVEIDSNLPCQFEALRRVHLIPSEDTAEETADTVNANMFCNLDSSVSEGGENFSTG
jgi:hypothetical protein